jgi:Ca2+-binding EF-hand superfamily protein
LYVLTFLLKGYTEEEATERAETIFETLDKNNDGSLAEDEFVKVQTHDETVSSDSCSNQSLGPVYSRPPMECQSEN